MLDSPTKNYLMFFFSLSFSTFKVKCPSLILLPLNSLCSAKKNADYAFTRRDSVMRFWLRYLSTLKVITRGFGLLGKINLSLLRWYSSELVHVSVLLKIETLWKVYMYSIFIN